MASFSVTLGIEHAYINFSKLQFLVLLIDFISLSTYSFVRPSILYSSSFLIKRYHKHYLKAHF